MTPSRWIAGSLGTLLAIAGLLWFLRGGAGGASAEGLAPGGAGTSTRDLADLAGAPPTEAGPPRAGVGAPARAEALAETPAAVPEPLPEADGPRLSGRVLAADGRPIGAARVFVAARAGFALDVELPPGAPPAFGRRTAETGADGRFALPAPAAGSLRLLVRAAGMAPLVREGLAVPEAAEHDLGDLVLAPGLVLAGRVVDAARRGVAGARLLREDPRLGPSLEWLDPAVRPLLGLTAPDGSFRLDELERGPWRLRVHHPEHPDGLFAGLLEASGERGLELALVASAAIEGAALGCPPDSLDRLVVSALPAAEGSAFQPVGAGQELRWGSLAADGRFRVAGLEQGRAYELRLRRAEGGGFFAGDPRSEVVTARPGDVDVRIAYRPAPALAFQVLDARSGTPVAGFVARIGLAGWDEPEALGPAVRGGADGRARVAELGFVPGPEGVRLEVEALGYRTLVLDALRLEPGGERDLGLLLLQPAPIVVVRAVRARAGTPIAGAEVVLEGPSAPPSDVGDGDLADRSAPVRPRRVAQTDALGVARLSSFEQPDCRLTVRAQGFAPERVDALLLPPGELVEHTVRLGPGGAVRVEVRAADGAPRAGVHVVHRRPIPARQAPTRATDPAGDALFLHLESGTHAFRLGPATRPLPFSDGEDEPDAWREIEVFGAVLLALRLVERPRATLVGVVREGGRALVGGEVTLRLADAGGADGLEGLLGHAAPPRARTDERGTFRLDELELGAYVVSVEHPERAMASEQPVLVDRPFIELVLELASCGVEGRVTAVGGEPLAGLRVRVERADDGGQARRRPRIVTPDGDEGFVAVMGAAAHEVVTDAQGRYRLGGVAAEVDIVVCVEGATVRATTSRALRLARDELRRGVDFEVEAAGELVVRASRPDGSAVNLCMVSARRADDSTGAVRRAFIVRGGSTVIEGLEPGEWELELRTMGGPAADFAPQTRTEEVSAGERREVEFVIP